MVFNRLAVSGWSGKQEVANIFFGSKSPLSSSQHPLLNSPRRLSMKRIAGNPRGRLLIPPALPKRVTSAINV
jgi:hypothetical protein